jgi:preprotein translocase subunit SecD
MKAVLILLATCLTSICPAMGDSQENRSTQPDQFLKAKPPTGNFAERSPSVPAQKGDIDSLGGVSQQQPDAVSVTLNGPGTDKMIALTANMRPGVDRIAIVLDGQVLSAPVIRQVPLGKDFIIEGLNDPGEVQNLANALTNPLGNPLKIDEMRTIPPKSK